jgi:1,4-alpha-glucan branching enzyme
MLSIEPGGKLILTIYLPGAARVQVVGAFGGWHEQRYDMIADDAGRWRLELHLGPGEFLFRYLIDGCCWALDGSGHGTRTTANGEEMSRVWMPPATLEPDAIAA